MGLDFAFQLVGPDLAVKSCPVLFFRHAGVIDWFAVAICALALFGMLRWKWDVIPVIAGSGILGLAYKLLVHT